MNKPGAYGGIDPGMTGAAALWSENNLVWFHDFKSVFDANVRLKEWAEKFEIKLFALEDPQAIPPAYGKNAQRALNRNFGAWETLLIVNKIRFIKVPPRDWQRIVPPYPYADPKKRSIQFCLDNFPGVENYLNKITKHHNRADALILAKYAREEDKVRKLSA